MDFLSDQLFNGSKIRVLTIVDAFTKLSPAIDVRRRYTGADMVATLERVTREHGIPRSIRVDQGPEFISKDLDLWAWMNGVILDFSRPGKPTDNAFAEAFNGKVRAECIDQNWFLPVEDARPKCEAYRHEYNHERPHSSIGNKTPIEFMKAISTTCPLMAWKTGKTSGQRSSVRGKSTPPPLSAALSFMAAVMSRRPFVTESNVISRIAQPSPSGVYRAHTPRVSITFRSARAGTGIVLKSS